MRAAWLVVVSLAIALLVQLTVLNGLRLPGGGVPDLVLVLVAALAMAEGPVPGMVTGFAAGLCLDLAPPGSAAVGQYALVFCLAGWAAGRLSPVASHSGRQSAGPLATALLALVVGAAEVLAAAVSVLVAPAAVTLSQARVVLPSTIGYDVALCPLVLPVIMLAGALVAGRSHGAQRFRRLASVGGSAGPDALDGAARSKRAARRASRQPELRLGRNAARAMDGWLSASRPPSRPRGRAPAGRTARLRPASGVPGSASGLAWHRSRPPAPVHLRLAGGRRGDGVVGTGGLAAVGGPRRAQPGRHPGLLAGRGRQFRPHGAEPGGSASGTHHLTARPPLRRQPAIRFGGHRGDGSFGHTLSHPPTRPGMTGRRRQSAIRFGGHHGDGSFGQTLSHPLTRPVLARGRRPAAIRFGQRGRASSRAWLRMGADRSAFAIAGASAVPSLKFSGRPAPASRRTTAVPRFHRKPALLQPTRMSSGVVPGGVLTEATFRARMRRPAPRRLRLAGGATGMLGGTGRGPRLRRPPTRTGRQPRFSYGKRSPLTVLARRPFGRRLGGRWLARWRVGSRSGVWLLGRRPGAWR